MLPKKWRTYYLGRSMSPLKNSLPLATRLWRSHRLGIINRARNLASCTIAPHHLSELDWGRFLTKKEKSYKVNLVRHSFPPVIEKKFSTLKLVHLCRKFASSQKKNIYFARKLIHTNWNKLLILQLHVCQ